jgi:mRNA interferase RelE/StbE
LGYRIEFRKSVAKDLRRIGRTDAAHVLDVIDERLPDEAAQCPELKGKFSGLRRYRIGEYRVIFVILDEHILILRIGHRRDIYRD